MYSQKDIDRPVSARASIEHSNQTKVAMRARILTDYKCILGVALLKAFKANAVQVAMSQMRNI